MKKSLFIVAMFIMAIAIGFGCSKAGDGGAGGGGDGNLTSDDSGGAGGSGGSAPAGNIAEGGTCTTDAECVSGLICTNGVCAKELAEVKDDGDYGNGDDGAGGSGAPSDADSDGIIDAVDNCVDIANADQADLDGDKAGDACDADDDADGIADAVDNCPSKSNPAQVDQDGDGVGTECESSNGSAPVIAVPNCPDIFTNALAVSIAFTVDETAVSKNCYVDGTKGACPADNVYSNDHMTEGTHSFYVEAMDAEEDLSTPVGCEWVVDYTKPEANFLVSVTPHWKGFQIFVTPPEEPAIVDANLSGYMVDFSNKGGDVWFPQWMGYDYFDGLVAYDPSLFSNGVDYEVWVKAVDKAGNESSVIKTAFVPQFNWNLVTSELTGSKATDVAGVMDDKIYLFYTNNIGSPYTVDLNKSLDLTTWMGQAELITGAPTAELSSLDMAKSDSGILHAVYVSKKDGNDVIEHAYQDGSGGWIVEDVYSAVFARDPSIALHGDDVWVVFQGPSGRMILREKIGGSWLSTINLASSMQTGCSSNPSALIKGDAVYVTYRNVPNDTNPSCSNGTSLRMKRCSIYDTCGKVLTAWATHSIDDGNGDGLHGSNFKDVGGSSTLIFDSALRPHVFYAGAVESVVLHAYNTKSDPAEWDGNGWIYQQINTANKPSNGYIAAAMDGSNNFHTAWYCSGGADCQTDKIYYAVTIADNKTGVYSSYPSAVQSFDIGWETNDKISGNFGLFVTDVNTTWICYNLPQVINCSVDKKP